MAGTSASRDIGPGFDWVRAISLASVIAWGLFAGTRVLNIPLMYWWRELPPREFVSWFADNIDRFNQLLLPLGAITGVLTAISLLAVWPFGQASGRRRFWAGLAAVCFAIVFALNPLFYDQANKDLSTPGALTDQEVTSTLQHWIDAQWVRTVVSVIGLAASGAALAATAGERRSAYSRLLQR